MLVSVKQRKGTEANTGTSLTIKGGVALVLLLPLGVFQHSIAETVFTYRAAESSNDLRTSYQKAALELALEKTREDYGPYQLVPSPRMTNPRAVSYLSNNLLPNLIIKLSYQPEYADNDLIYAPFPVDLGIVGYRICFTSTVLAKELSSINTLADLQQYTHGQGVGWRDTDILRYNGMTVTTVPNYNSLFLMVSKQRFDLFCRGVNELATEYQLNKKIDGLAYDTHFALVYELPRFFYTHKHNAAALERVQTGLERAYADGSLVALWKQAYQPSIEFARLQDRVLLRLENPYLKGIDSSYKRYNINPLNPAAVDKELLDRASNEP